MEGLKMKYFVLKPEAKFPGDPYAKASREAMLKYAEYMQTENPKLVVDLVEWINAEEKKEERLKEGEAVTGYTRMSEKRLPPEDIENIPGMMTRAYTQVADGTDKSVIENAAGKVTAYKCGTITRIDIKED